jgi:hypothetical protein
MNKTDTTILDKKIENDFFDVAKKVLNLYPDAHISGSSVAEFNISSSIIYNLILEADIENDPEYKETFKFRDATFKIITKNNNEVILRGEFFEDVEFLSLNNNEICLSFFIDTLENTLISCGATLIENLRRKKDDILNEMKSMKFVYYESFLLNVNGDTSYIIDILEDLNPQLEEEDVIGHLRVIGYSYQLSNSKVYTQFMDKLLIKSLNKTYEWQDFPSHLYE